MSETESKPKPKNKIVSFVDFARSRIQELRDQAKKRDEQQQKLRSDKLASLREAAARRERLHNFLESAFWKKDLEPLLKRLNDNSQNKPWTPGTPADIETHWADHMFWSGKAFVLKGIESEMNLWDVEGVQALLRLKQEAEYAKALAEKKYG